MGSNEMSGKVYGEAYAVIPEAVLYSNISPNAKLLYGILARHADPAGKCYPGLKRLSDLMMVSDQTVRRAKQELMLAGFLEAKPCYDDQGRQTTDSLILIGGGIKSDTLGGIKSDTPGSKASSNEKLLHASTTKTSPLHVVGPVPRFECPVCPKDAPQPGCTVCDGEGTFAMEAQA
jgi:hypothetical protein